MAYPPLQPFDSGILEVEVEVEVEDGSGIYWETSGNPAGVYILWLHGGPGSGFEISRLTTQALIDDLKSVRQHLAIARWVVSGGSWGTTLALAFAEAHPGRVGGLALPARLRREIWEFVKHQSY